MNKTLKMISDKYIYGTLKYARIHYHKKMINMYDTNKILYHFILSNQPFMTSRIGAIEISCLRYFLKKRLKKNVDYTNEIISTISNNAGFFPANNENLDKFANIYFNDNATHTKSQSKTNCRIINNDINFPLSHPANFTVDVLLDVKYLSLFYNFWTCLYSINSRIKGWLKWKK